MQAACDTSSTSSSPPVAVELAAALESEVEPLPEKMDVETVAAAEEEERPAEPPEQPAEPKVELSLAERLRVLHHDAIALQVRGALHLRPPSRRAPRPSCLPAGLRSAVWLRCSA